MSHQTASSERNLLPLWQRLHLSVSEMEIAQVVRNEE